MSDHENSNGILYGTWISLFSSLIATLGYAIQKMGHIRAQNGSTNYLKEPLWIIGMLLIIISIPIYSLSLLFASQTAMSMIPTLSILFILFWSWLLLNEKVDKITMVAIAFLTPGTAIILASSDVAESEMSTSTFNQYLFSNGSLIFLSSMLLVFMVGGISSIKIIQHTTETEEDLMSNPQDIDTENASNFSKNVAELLNYRWNLIPMLYLPWFAGLFCCLSSTLAKSLLTIYKEGVSNHKNWFLIIWQPYSIILIVNIVLLSFLSFYLLNKGLQHFEPIYTLPIEKVSLLINNLLWGGIILREFEEWTLHQFLGFLIGIVLCTIGVMMFLLKKDQSNQMQEFMDAEIKEAKLDASIDTKEILQEEDQTKELYDSECH